MAIILSIVALHFFVIFAGRKIKTTDAKGIAMLVLLTVLLVSVVLYSMFTMDNPEVNV